MVHQPGHQIAEQDTNASAQKTNGCCLQQELFPDIPKKTAHSLHDPDFPGSLRNGHDHGVGNSYGRHKKGYGPQASQHHLLLSGVLLHGFSDGFHGICLKSHLPDHIFHLFHAFDILNIDYNLGVLLCLFLTAYLLDLFLKFFHIAQAHDESGTCLLPCIVIFFQLSYDFKLLDFLPLRDGRGCLVFSRLGGFFLLFFRHRKFGSHCLEKRLRVLIVPVIHHIFSFRASAVCKLIGKVLSCQDFKCPVLRIFAVCQGIAHLFQILFRDSYDGGGSVLESVLLAGSELQFSQIKRIFYDG